MLIHDNPYVVSKLVCHENIPLSKLVASDTLRQSVEARTGQKLPSSNQALKKMIFNFHKNSENYVTGKIKDDTSMKSVTIDECCSCNNKRFLNVNIHCSSGNFCLGLVQGCPTCGPRAALRPTQCLDAAYY